jgi:FtsP/CotA-like multicopper oxidase with cupredoxin domain
MKHFQMKLLSSTTRLILVCVIVAAMLFTTRGYAAVPGITGTAFHLTAEENYVTQPDGALVYSWGYGCDKSSTPTFAPFQGFCNTMQVPGPTLIVHEGDTVSVTLRNNLPVAAGNTSIIFPGFQVTADPGDPGVPGLLVPEAATGATVTYTFVASKPGTHSYYSGTEGDLQIEMGLYGALIVLPKSSTGCATTGEYSLAPSAYDDTSATSTNPTCYDREYLFQFAEMDPRIHKQAEAIAHCTVAPGVVCPANMQTVAVEPYHPAYFLINGRSMPDDMDANYAPQYPHQPYNGNPHMHPGELTLLRVIGTGRWQHPFHEHGNHVRLLARDGNLLVSSVDSTKLAGPLLFTTSTTPGQALDAIYYWSGRGLNWDVYAHKPNDGSACTPDANGYFTTASGATKPVFDSAGNFVTGSTNYYEWCADHNKPLETHPYGSVGSGGPTTLPDALILADGAWYSGTPYLGPDAAARSVGGTPIPPAGTVVNSPETEAGFAFMWHSHNEREITTNDIFPGGMMMMMLVDPPVFHIDESQ